MKNDKLQTSNDDRQTTAVSDRVNGSFDDLNAKYTNAAILSASSPNNELVQEAADIALEETIEDRAKNRFLKIQGCYKGETENSYIVFSNDTDDLHELAKLALFILNQESILFLDRENNKAVLQYNDHYDIIGTKLVKQESTDNLERYNIIEGNIYAVE